MGLELLSPNATDLKRTAVDPNDEPISPQCMRDLNEAKELVASGSKVPCEKTREWMSSRHREVQSLIYEWLRGHHPSIEAPPRHEVEQFYLEFLEASLRENKGNEYRFEQYEAVMEIHAWIRDLWHGRPDTIQTLERVRDMLRCLCIEGDDELRGAVLFHSFEHLFMNREIADFFADWANDGRLTDMYNRAIWLADTWRKMKFI